jgi:hypothetical protein
MCLRDPNEGRAKTSAHSVVALIRFASPCAGFEPCPSIDSITNGLSFENLERIFIVAADAAKAPNRKANLRR